MSILRGSSIFIDSNIIIEAQRIRILNHLLGYYSNLATVGKCIEEIHTGNRPYSNNIQIKDNLLSRLSTKNVNDIMRADLALKLNGLVSLDEGEKELLAFVNSIDTNSTYVCSPDKACMRACHILGFVDRVISLEKLISNSTSTKQAYYKNNFSEKWLNSFKTGLLLEN